MTYEKTADELELASHLQEQMNIAGRKACEQSLAPQKAEGFDGVHCIDCEDTLPQVRIVMGRVRCTCCQVEADRLKKLGR